jgi:hypothetical protein
MLSTFCHVRYSGWGYVCEPQWSVTQPCVVTNLETPPHKPSPTHGIGIDPPHLVLRRGAGLGEGGHGAHEAVAGDLAVHAAKGLGLRGEVEPRRDGVVCASGAQGIIRPLVQADQALRVSKLWAVGLVRSRMNAGGAASGTAALQYITPHESTYQ